MDLSIPAAAMEARIVKPACAVRLMGNIPVGLILPCLHTDWDIGTAAHLMTTVAPGVKAPMVNAQEATNTSVMLDTVDTISVVLCIECLGKTFLTK